MKTGWGSLGNRTRLISQPTTPRTVTSRAERAAAPPHFLAAVGPPGRPGRVALPSRQRPRPAAASVVMGSLLSPGPLSVGAGRTGIAREICLDASDCHLFPFSGEFVPLSWPGAGHPRCDPTCAHLCYQEFVAESPHFATTR